MNTNFSYDKMDYYSILEYLKSQAEYFSDGQWTDFSDADIGTVILKLMAMNADTTNYQIEKGVSELYLDTAIERVNAIALCKLIGYEPRHYLSAYADLTCNYDGETLGANMPAFTLFTDNTGNVKFYSLERVDLAQGVNTIRVYQGELVTRQYNFNNIDENGRIILDDYNIGVNTVVMQQAGVYFKRVPNAIYGEGDLCFSVHINLDNNLYIQLPTYYASMLSPSTTIEVNYLLSSGSDGRIGSGVLTGTYVLPNGYQLNYINENASIGGYNPETVEEIRKEAPAFASTMDTVVTLNDFRILSRNFPNIADAVALDYNYPESGLIQPTDGQVNDAYKVNLYILPQNSDEIHVVNEEDTEENVGSESLNIIPSVGQYTFTEQTDSETGEKYFINTNIGVDNTSADFEFIWNTETAHDTFKVSIDLSGTIEGYDYVNLYKNNEPLDYISGNQEKELSLSVITNSYLFNYIKNGTGYTENDEVKLKFYKIIQGTPIITDEYKDEIVEFIDDINKKKPAGIQVNYLNVDYIRPHLVVNVYMDQTDLRYASTADTISNYLENLYSRDNFKIGEPLYKSHISKDILSNFNYINYLEIVSLEGSVDGAIKPSKKEYIELLAENITINVLPYES